MSYPEEYESKDGYLVLCGQKPAAEPVHQVDREWLTNTQPQKQTRIPFSEFRRLRQLFHSR